jgi:hypothetical protein
VRARRAARPLDDDRLRPRARPADRIALLTPVSFTAQGRCSASVSTHISGTPHEIKNSHRNDGDLSLFHSRVGAAEDRHRHGH